MYPIKTNPLSNNSLESIWESNQVRDGKVAVSGRVITNLKYLSKTQLKDQISKEIAYSNLEVYRYSREIINPTKTRENNIQLSRVKL